MKERGILFSAPMVRSIIDDLKTHTRRGLKTLGADSFDFVRNAKMGGPGGGPWWDGGWHGDERVNRFKCPYGVPGDRLWVRETWKPHSLYAGMRPRDVPHTKIFYRADDGYAPSNTPWVPAIHMPRWASRLTLEIADVRAERLNDISEGDAVAEGLRWIVPGKWSVGHNLPIIGDDPRRVYRELWEHINGPGAWEANPWVWVTVFRKVEAESAAA